MRPFGSRPPKKVSIASWNLVKLDGGKAETGFVAGPYVGVHCHMSQRIKPCLACYGTPRDECDGCRQKFRYEWRPYFPFYAGDAQFPTVACLTLDSVGVLDKLELHQYVTVRRGPRDKSPLFVVPMTKPQPWSPRSEAHEAVQDICDWLPVMWKLRGRITGSQIRAGGDQTEADISAVVLTDKGVPTGKVEYSIDPAKGPEDKGLSRQQINDRYAAAMRATKNGVKHANEAEGG